MGMCKKCQNMFNDSKLTLGYCATCYPQINEEILEKVKEDEEKKKQQEQEDKERRKQQEQQDKEYAKKLEKILILSGAIIDKKHTVHGIVSVVAESVDAKDITTGLHRLTVIEAEILMREELVQLGCDGVLNVKMDSTVTLGKRKRNDGLPSYTVAFYGDAFSYI